MILMVILICNFLYAAKKTESIKNSNKNNDLNMSKEEIIREAEKVANMTDPWVKEFERLYSDKDNQIWKEAINRKPSSTEVSNLGSQIENDSDYKNFLIKFKKIKTTDDVDELLNKLEERLKLNPDKTAFDGNATKSLALKFIGSQLLPFRAYKGFIYRMVPILSKTSPRAVHSFILSSVLITDNLIKNLLPNPRWKALFDYMAEPPSLTTNGKFTSYDAVVKSRFDYESNIQEFLFEELLPDLQLLKARMEIIKKDLIASNTNIIWDNSIFYNNENENSVGEDRYRKLVTADFLFCLSALDANIGTIYYLNSYNLNGYFNLLGQLGKLYGFDGLPKKENLKHSISDEFHIHDFMSKMFKDRESINNFLHAFLVTGGPASERKHVFDNFRKQYNSGVLVENKVLHAIPNKTNFKTRMALAYNAFKSSFEYAENAWTNIQSNKEDVTTLSYLMDSVNPASRTLGIGFDNVKNMFEGQNDIKSALTNETIKVNLKKIMVDDPIEDLYDLLPTETLKKERYLSKSIGKKVLYYRNYEFGRSTAWNFQAYKKLFPDLTDDGDSVRMHMRVLSQSWGGVMAALPLSFVMF